MSNVSRILDLFDKVNSLQYKIENLESEIKSEEGLTQFVLEFGESIDPEFRKKCLAAWDKEKNKTWDWQSIIGNPSFRTSESEKIYPDHKEPKVKTFEYNPAGGEENER